MNADSIRQMIETGLPGARRVTPVSSQLRDDPRGATSETDYVDTTRAQALVGWRAQLSPRNTLVLEGGHRQKEQQALVSSYVDTDLGTTFLSPRLENRHRLGRIDAHGHEALGRGADRLDTLERVRAAGLNSCCSISERRPNTRM
mgnify:CR=1 FL=1